MDSLTALRQAIATGRDALIQEEGTDLVIEGVRYPGDAPTAFKQSKGPRYYALLGVYLQWKLRGLSGPEYMKAAKAAKTQFVLVTDKVVLLDYLRGSSEATDYIDASKLGALPAATGQAGGKAPGADEALTLEMAMRREVAYRTHASVLQAPGKNLRDDVFKLFTINAPVAAVPSVSAASSSRAGPGARQAPEAASAAASRKRPRAGAAGADGDDLRGTPTILIPAGSSSLITMYNAAAFLQEGRFVAPAEARAAAGGGAKPARLVIKRKDSHGNDCQYYVVDSAEGLDWKKVVAVFAQGPEWQFKGWRIGPKDPATGLHTDIPPVQLFDLVLGFHVMFDGDAPHENASKWAVTPLRISKTRRYTDSAVAQQFWAALDAFIWMKRPRLLPKGVHNADAGRPVGAPAASSASGSRGPAGGHR